MARGEGGAKLKVATTTSIFSSSSISLFFFFFLFATRFALDSISPFLLLFFGYRDIGLRYRIARNFRRGDSQSFAALSQSKVKLDSWGVSRSFEPRNVVVFAVDISRRAKKQVKRVTMKIQDRKKRFA